MGFDLHGKSGNYFRASSWSWRPIHALCVELNEALGLDLSGWDYNDGAGLHTQSQCNELADAIEAHLAEGRLEYVVTFVGCDRNIDPIDGQLLPKGQGGGVSPWRTDADHILEFVKFLRECGGEFTID